MTEKNEQKVVPAVYGMRRKGTTAIVGMIPNNIAAVPPRQKEYLRDFEEVPLYTTPPLDALRALEEPIGEVGKMPGTDGFTMACFDAGKVPVGTKLFLRPYGSGRVLLGQVRDFLSVWNQDTSELDADEVVTRMHSLISRADKMAATIKAMGGENG